MMPETRGALKASRMGKAGGMGVPESTRRSGVGVRVGVGVDVKVGVKVGRSVGVEVRVGVGDSVAVRVGVGVANKGREVRRQ